MSNLSTFGYGKSKIGDFVNLCQRLSTLKMWRKYMTDSVVP